MRLKGRVSMCAALDMLELDNLSKQHNKSRYALFLAILSIEECHEALSYSYVHLRPPYMAVTTRAVSGGEPQTIYEKSSAYQNSFLPHTEREIKTSHYTTKHIINASSIA